MLPTANRDTMFEKITVAARTKSTHAQLSFTGASTVVSWVNKNPKIWGACIWNPNFIKINHI